MGLPVGEETSDESGVPPGDGGALEVDEEPVDAVVDGVRAGEVGVADGDAELVDLVVGAPPAVGRVVGVVEPVRVGEGAGVADGSGRTVRCGTTRAGEVEATSSGRTKR